MNGRPPRSEHLRDLGAAIERFARLLARAAGDEPVEHCPGWSTRDLALHLGSIHRWAAAIVLSASMPPAEPEPLVRGELADWYRDTGDALLAALRAVDPAEPTPNFARVHETAAFWPRRQLHEVTVHTVDLAHALGLSPPEIPGELAADGVDELLTVFFARLAARGSAPDVRANVRLRALDTGDDWVLGRADAGEAPALLQLGAPAEASIEGAASDLYLALWGRAPHSLLRVTGEEAEALLVGPTCA